MSKTPSTTQMRTTTSTKANPKTPTPARPRTADRGQAATGNEKQLPARKATPAATAHPAAQTSRAKGRAAPAPTVPAVAVPVTRRPSKVASIEALLRRQEGAAIADLVMATGWQQHSVRAALTGLRKQGHNLIKEAGPAGNSVYRITQDQPAKA